MLKIVYPKEQQITEDRVLAIARDILSNNGENPDDIWDIAHAMEICEQYGYLTFNKGN